MQKAMRWCKRRPSCPTGNVNFECRGGDEYLIRNGSKLLEERINLFHGKTNPIRCFSAAELKAIIISGSSSGSNNNIRLLSYFFKCYNGVVDGRKVLIGTSHRMPIDKVIRDIAVSTEMSSHNNVHKLLGCCLETKHPALVFEWLENGINLLDRLHRRNNQEGLEWKDRLRIAWQISHAIAYLHTAFPRPIIHRDIKPSNVLLDQQDNTAKLSGFYFSESIPEGKTYLVADVAGTYGYLAPEYLHTGRVDEKIDVYSFGGLLLVLLTGRNADEILEWDTFETEDNNQVGCINEIIDPTIHSNATSTTQEDLLLQLQAALKLALLCTDKMAENRPTMVEVATQLKNMLDQAL